MVVGVEARDEGFVAADDDHQQEVGDHHHVDEVKDCEHDGVFIHDAEVDDEVPQRLQKFPSVNHLHDDQAKINRQLYPAAGKNNAGDGVGA